MSEFVRQIQSQKEEDVSAKGELGDADMEDLGRPPTPGSDDRGEFSEPEPSGDAEDDVGGAGFSVADALSHFRTLGDLRTKETLVGRASDTRPLDVGKADPRGSGEVKLDYIDEFGRKLTPEEAFRQLSYKFHGQKPSKNKQEKRLKKYVEELRLRQKNSGGETPLSSVAALKKETRATSTPFVIVSGKAALETALVTKDDSKGPDSSRKADGASLKRDAAGVLLRKSQKRPRG
eukprot:Plantae.Rhodophyta-Rhodochaete_pulchella.ctg17107.p1 GENE.Plantae.Rhodophyta-Rhodochaete_pulchella.ctg17107~~Plantae.Rhodophyta-Rhodochaete_pulchella.ctg17107.p1  ORF type:complete len:234 (-),score=50.23 Plantae.Rhodophyta-Rhodochaete_pulchella.ctg17107:249-950(-)